MKNGIEKAGYSFQGVYNSLLSPSYFFRTDDTLKYKSPKYVFPCSFIVSFFLYIDIIFFKKWSIILVEEEVEACPFGIKV